MSSINSKLKAIHLSGEQKYEFKDIDLSVQSYYMDYSLCSHVESPLISYDSQNIKEIRERLQALWKKNKTMQKYIPVVLMSMSQELFVEKDRIEIDLYNYMM